MMVGDASVWINLIATGRADRILRALGPPLNITDIAFGELERGRSKGRQAADEVTALVHVGLVEVIPLQEVDEALFLSMVAGAASDTLDDGEAATLACAQRLSACAVIDERKATRLASQRFPMLEVQSTADLLLSPETRAALPDAELADALFGALTQARMRVPECHAETVMAMLGLARAAQCFSLPMRIRGLRHRPH